MASFVRCSVCVACLRTTQHRQSFLGLPITAPPPAQFPEAVAKSTPGILDDLRRQEIFIEQLRERHTLISSRIEVTKTVCPGGLSGLPRVPTAALPPRSPPREWGGPRQREWGGGIGGVRV